MKKRLKIFLLTPFLCGCMSYPKQDASSQKGIVKKVVKSSLCRSIERLVKRGSECAGINKKVTGQEALDLRDFHQLCRSSEQSQGAGLSPHKGFRSFKEWMYQITNDKLRGAKRAKDEALRTSRYILKQYTDGYGVGFGVQGTAVASASVLTEVLTHKKSLGLFCAASVGVATDIAVSANVMGIKTFGCQNNKHYTGQFLSFGLSGSFEAAAIPFEVGITLNLGFDVFKLIDRLVSIPENRRRQLLVELEQLSKLDLGEDSRFAGDLVTALSLNYMQSHGFDAKQMIYLMGNRDHNKIRKALLSGQWSSQESLASLGKALDRQKGFFTVKEVLTAMIDSLSGCDSIAIFAGPSLSLSPISLQVSLSQYELLSEATLPTFQQMNKFFHAVGTYSKAQFQRQSCELNLEQMNAYVEILKMLKFMDDVSKIAPGLRNGIKCGQKLMESSISFQNLLNEKIKD